MPASAAWGITEEVDASDTASVAALARLAAEPGAVTTVVHTACELREMPAAELDRQATTYEAKAVSPRTAAPVAAELRPMMRWPPMSIPNYGFTPRFSQFSVGGRACGLVHDRCAVTLLALCCHQRRFSRSSVIVAMLIAWGRRELSVRIGEPRRSRRSAVVTGGPDDYRHAVAGRPLFATGVNCRRDRYSRFWSRYRHRVD